MGILDFLSKDSRQQKKIARAVKRANNKHMPKDYRQAALHDVVEFAKTGNAQALRGLIDRFAVNAEPSIEDEQEKEWVCDAMIDMGQTAVEQLKRALRSAESVNWIQRVYRNIVSLDEYKLELLEVLSDFDTEYERNPDRKIQTIMALAEMREQAIAEVLIRFLEDVDETVRFQTVVALAKQEDELAREPLLKTMCEDESIRVRNEVVESFAKLAWVTQGFKKKVSEILPSGYKHDKSGRIIKLGG